MIRHLLRLVWNRKRSTALLLVELFVTFLVVALVGTTALYQLTNWNRPLGFEWRELLIVNIDYKRTGDDQFSLAETEGFARLLAEVRALPEVAGVAGAHLVPFEISRMSNNFELDGRQIKSNLNEVTDDLLEVMQLDLVAGRWFSAEDAGVTHQPVVVDRDLAAAAFGSAANALGKVLRAAEPATEDGPARKEIRVIGVIADFRAGGELAGPGNFFFRHLRPGDPDQRPLMNLVLRPQPGVGAEFEERLARRLTAIGPDWSYEIRPLADYRRSGLKLRTAPLVAGGVVGSFLLAMVALGLTGVVWQNVSERTREVGLRRALGATGTEIHRQFVLEMLLLSTLAVGAGTVIVLQLPLLDLLGAVPVSVVVGGLAIATATLSAIAAAAAWMPSRMASRIPPSEALRYE